MLEKCIGKIEIGRQSIKSIFLKKLFGLFFKHLLIMLCIYEKDGESDIHISLRKKKSIFRDNHL